MFFLADGDMAVLTPGRRAPQRFRRPPREPPGDAHSVGPHHGGKGRLQAFHAQGNLRAAARRPRHHAGPRGAGDAAAFFWTRWTSRPKSSRASGRSRSSPAAPVGTPALAGKFMIEKLARIPVEVDYGSEFRYRDPIVGRRHADRGDFAIGRDRRYAGGAARGQAEGLEDAGHLQRGRLHDHARSRGHHLHARRSGDRRGIHQSVHLPVDGAVHSGDVSGPGATGGSTRAASRCLVQELLRIPGKLETVLSHDAVYEELAQGAASAPPIFCSSAAACISRSRSKARSS